MYMSYLFCIVSIEVDLYLSFFRFLEKLLFLLPALQGLFRSYCLEILETQADVQSQFYLKLKDKGFHKMLSHRSGLLDILFVFAVKMLFCHFQCMHQQCY